MSRWWRAYDEAVDDPKLILLTDKQHRAWFNLCCITSQNGGKLPAVAVVAVKLRMTPDKARNAVAELVALGLVDQQEGVFAPHNWNSRQYKADEPKAPKGKDSYVYVVGHAWGADALKIGFSKNPWARLSELQTAHHEKLSVLAVFKCQSHSEVDVHDLLKPYRKSGEWFSLPSRIYVAINNAADRSVSYDELVDELRSLLRSATTETDNRSINRGSEATASAADAAPEPVGEEPKAKLFRIGKTILVSFGVAEKRTGTLIGQWLKSRNDPEGLLGAIEYAREQNVADPVAYISVLLSRAKPNGHHGKQDLSAMCFAIADELRAKERAGGDVRSDELFGGR